MGPEDPRAGLAGAWGPAPCPHVVEGAGQLSGSSAKALRRPELVPRARLGAKPLGNGLSRRPGEGAGSEAAGGPHGIAPAGLRPPQGDSNISAALGVRVQKRQSPSLPFCGAVRTAR